ncbi:MAG: preprotein translocase subunit SecY [Candidatus Taylorbacteria bacterium CG10_big_fil_rev_8_21_14_0_10_41_48]|uniref:Protein translocase subunit SecY n=1 Tax=Candidatus Taylorbacteria bacterium CG10_big_fil_rev_8_21_14_0_10_41_48 TaxID=1975024 RepID=A0A2M8LCW0_9BACT|nr:MAG: preprotein translocase subunit SecY [Candidatus Taylorbacteria bacterium CG10_big_fil_rev_8_21_14_0_10_41_48]
MNTFIEKISFVFRDKQLRRRIFFVVLALAVTRLLTTLPIPGIDPVRLASLFENSQFLGLLNLFSGGGLSNLSIVMLGVGPYITASIIMQLLTIMSPKLKAMYQEDGEAGRIKFAQYSRWITLPLSLIQAFSFIVLFQRQGILPSLEAFDMVLNTLVVASGSIIFMWIGELISEFGLGNGTSLIIFAGIISRMPQAISGSIAAYDPSQLPVYLGILVLGLIIIYAVVVVTEAERPIPVTYAKQVRGMKVYGGVSTYLPLRLNQAGVIPIIFALSILLFPQMIFNFLSTSGNAILKHVSDVGLSLVNNHLLYNSAYFLLVFLFTYFYTAVTFDPIAISENLQKSGAFIPGVRPGHSTAEYLSKIVTRITLVGALFLGVIAVLPLILRTVSGLSSLAIGGTALLIVVSVVLDLVKKIDAQVSMREY